MNVLLKTRVIVPSISHARDANRFTRLRLMMMFGAEWEVELNDVTERIKQLKSGQEFAGLFAYIVTASNAKCYWIRKPNGRACLQDALVLCKASWNKHLRFEQDQQQATLEYLAEALMRFKS